MVRTLRTALCSAFFLAVAATGCVKGRPSPPLAVLVDGTGTYSLAISTSSSLAQQFFDQGLRLTYGYYFPEAAASFQQALEYDAHPMIYWGLALAVSPNPNSRYMGFADDPAGKGKEAIEKAARLSSKASEKHQAFIDALFVRYDSETHPDRRQRDLAYLAAMHEVIARYPDDPDAATLYADAAMTLSPWLYWDKDGEPLPGTLEAAQVLERAMERHPDHPGANHVYIHLIEASPFPERAVPQADRIEALMPRAGHIVHMPSHIYVRVGRYKDAITTNERSIEADRYFLGLWGDRPFPAITSHKLSAQFHAWHANDFIRYAATVQGNYAKAIATARSSATVAMAKQSMADGRTQRAVATVWLVQKIFGRWDELLAERAPPGDHCLVDGIWHYARGSALIGRRDVNGARAEAALLEAAAQRCRGRVAGLANTPRALLRLATFGLRGELAQAVGDIDAAVDAFERAVAAEDELRYIEPPDWPQPMRHYLGAALLSADRAASAERVYAEDLRWNQDNGWALYGVWQSLLAQGRSTDAEQAHRRFLKAWQDADVELRASRF